MTESSGAQGASGTTGAMAIEPEGVREWLRDAVEAGGATVVPPEDAEALLWAAPDDPAGLREVLAEHGDHLRWVQLPWAGIEPYVDVLDHYFPTLTAAIAVSAPPPRRHARKGS